MANNKKKGFTEKLVEEFTEQALLLAQIKLLMKLHPEFKKDLKALMAKYSKKPNPIKDVRKMFNL